MLRSLSEIFAIAISLLSLFFVDNLYTSLLHPLPIFLADQMNVNNKDSQLIFLTQILVL